MTPNPPTSQIGESVTPVFITSHLDTWTSAIKTKSTAGRGSGKKEEFYGIKKLRELILELAVRGLLVPQDPEDEPASELLKKIAKEKVTLIKSGKMKKQKDLPPLSKDELEFSAPVGWKWIRLQDVAEYIQRGKGPKYADNGSVRVVSQKCIQWTGFDLSAARFVSDESLAKYQPERFLRSNDLLWNSTGTGTAGRINRIDNIPESTLVADSHVTIVRLLNFNSSFINSYISSSSIQNRLQPTHENSLVSGTTNQVELNTSSAINLPVPLPPLAEQQRIVAKVDELMALCDQLEQRQEDSVRTHATLVEALLGALTTASDRGAFAEAWQRIAAHFDTLFTTESSIDQLKQTILQLAVMGKLVEQDPGDEPAAGDLRRSYCSKDEIAAERKIRKDKETYKPTAQFEVPENWEWVCIGSFCHVLGGKRVPRGYSLLDSPTSHVYIRVTDMKNETVTEEGLKYIDDDIFDQISRYIINKEDVYVTIAGTIGATGTIPDNLDGMNLTENAAKLVFREISQRFMVRVISSAYVQQQFGEAMNQMAQPKLSLESIKKSSVAIPPLAEQHRIVAKVDELMSLCDRLKARLQSAQTTQLYLADSLVEQAVG